MRRVLLIFSAVAAVVCVIVFWSSARWLERGTFSSLAGHDLEKSTIGVILGGSRYDGGYNEELVRNLYRIKDLPVRFSFMEQVNPDDDTLLAATDVLVGRDNARVIIASGLVSQNDIANVSLRYPGVKFFFATSGDMIHSAAGNVGTYIIRLYRVQYLAGVLAALESKTGHIAIAAPGRAPRTNAVINAFALGAQAAKKDIVVHTIWTGTLADGAKASAKVELALARHPEIDFIGQAIHQRAIIEAAKRHKLPAIVIGDSPEAYSGTAAGAIVWDSREFWRNLLLATLEGRFEGTSYSADLGDDLRLDLAAEVPEAIATRVREVERRLRYTDMRVFSGPIYDQAGSLRVPPDGKLADAAILGRIDWFVKGIVEDS